MGLHHFMRILCGSLKSPDFSPYPAKLGICFSPGTLSRSVQKENQKGEELHFGCPTFRHIPARFARRRGRHGDPFQCFWCEGLRVQRGHANRRVLCFGTNCPNLIFERDHVLFADLSFLGGGLRVPILIGCLRETCCFCWGGGN